MKKTLPPPTRKRQSVGLSVELATWRDGFARDLKTRLRRSPRTVAAYVDVVGRYLEFSALESPRPAAGSIRAFLRDAGATLAKSSQAQWSSALKGFLAWGRREKLPLPDGLEREITRPKVPRKLIEVFNEDDLDGLLEVIAGRPVQERFLFELLYGCGLRITEAITLQWRDVDLAASTLRVLGKGRKWREVPLSPGASEIVRALRALPSQNAESVWPGPVSAGRLRAWVVRWGVLAGFESEGMHLHPHKLRHSLATHLLRRGARLPQLQKLLGHERLTTTERYTHLDPQDLVKIYDKAFPKPRKIR